MATECLPLEGDCTIGRSRELHALMVDALARSETLTLDVGAVTHVDVTFAQLLVSASKSADAAGRGLSVARMSTTLRDMLGRAGLAFDDASGRLSPREG